MLVGRGDGERGHTKVQQQGVAREKEKPVSIKVLDEADGRFVILTYADGAVVREAVDPKKRPARRPRRPQQTLKAERMDRTRKKSY